MHRATLIHEETFTSAPEKLFKALHTPSAIREWWGATSVIVVPMEGGYFVIAWGEEEDPMYFSVARISVFEPPHKMVFADYQYYAKDGHIPIEADFSVTFEVHAKGEGSELRIVHDGFPPGSDEFYDGCIQGWIDTCAGIHRYLDSEPAE